MKAPVSSLIFSGVWALLIAFTCYDLPKVLLSLWLFFAHAGLTMLLFAVRDLSAIRKELEKMGEDEE